MAELQEKTESAAENLGKPLNVSATRALQEFVSDLRESLLVEANRVSSDDHVTEHDLLQAYKRLSFPSKDSLAFADAQTVISQALRENIVLNGFPTEWPWCFFCLGWFSLALESRLLMLPHE